MLLSLESAAPFLLIAHMSEWKHMILKQISYFNNGIDSAIEKGI